MLSSSGFFNDIVCPFFKSGLCERPHCQYKHQKELPTASKSSNGSQSRLSSLNQPNYVPTPKHMLPASSAPKRADPEASEFPAYQPTPISELKKLGLKEGGKRSSEDSSECSRKKKKHKRDKEKRESESSDSGKSDRKEKSSRKSSTSSSEGKTKEKSAKKKIKEERVERDSVSSSTSKPSHSESSDSSSKKRVAHVAADTVAPVVVAKTTFSIPKRPRMTATEVMYNRFKTAESKSEEEAKKKSSTNSNEETSSDKKRVAHAVKAVVKQEIASKRPTLPRDHGKGGKVPLLSRQQYLKLIIDECVKICASHEDAYERGLTEEKQIYDRSKSRLVYASLAANTVKRLRSESGSGMVATSTNVGGNRVVSHADILNGPRAANCSIEKRKKALTLEDLSDSMLYACFKKYVLSQEKLKDYGYPLTDPGKDGCAVLPAIDSKTLNNFKTNLRVCCRCKRNFTVDERGAPTRTEECVYHYGRLWNERSHGQVDRKYSCCKADIHAGGCCSAPSHVVDGYGHPDFAKGYVATKAKKLSSESNAGVYALDCEMCNTTVGMELTRVSVVDHTFKSIYETMVKPANPILDYNTKFSGITAADLEGVTTTLQAVQKHLLKLFSSETILVGHSLESDLKALKLIHNTVVDTAEVFPHRRGLPFKRALRTLVAEHLLKIIQDAEAGHNSQEDAISCMQLMLMKIKHDVSKLRPSN